MKCCIIFSVVQNKEPIKIVNIIAIWYIATLSVFNKASNHFSAQQTARTLQHLYTASNHHPRIKYIHAQKDIFNTLIFSRFAFKSQYIKSICQTSLQSIFICTRHANRPENKTAGISEKHCVTAKKQVLSGRYTEPLLVVNLATIYFLSPYFQDLLQSWI